MKEGKLTDLTIQKISEVDTLSKLDGVLIWYLQNIGKQEIADAYLKKYSELPFTVPNK